MALIITAKNKLQLMKIIKVISFIIVVLLSSCKPTLPDLTKRDRIKLLKKYAFYLCMEHNYNRIDSTFRVSERPYRRGRIFSLWVRGFRKDKGFRDPKHTV